MTCVVGLVSNGRIYMGADSAGVAGYSMIRRADEKVFAVGEFVIGFTSSFRMGQALRYSFNPPRIETWDIWRYMATSFVDSCREAMKTAGFLETNSGQESGGTFLVGVRGQLFTVESDFQVGVSRHPYASVGCGDHIALGSLYTSTALAPRTRVEMALAAAEEFSAGVRGPFVVIETPTEPPGESTPQG
jgi:ATP-dependent protease HslVU (ClpYQ) peptidase subunit